MSGDKSTYPLSPSKSRDVNTCNLYESCTQQHNTSTPVRPRENCINSLHLDLAIQDTEIMTDRDKTGTVTVLN